MFKTIVLPNYTRLSAPTSGSARRRARERRRAEQTRAEGERLARERREQRARDKVEQQRQAREELASYEPWGRAGGGAPNARGVRFTNLRTRGIYPEDELRGTALYEACRRFPTPRRRYRRTPLRLREDPQLCYAENLRKTIDNDVRYKQTPTQQQSYREILDEMVENRRRAMKDEIKETLDYERRMHTLDGPWGKPGPGGAVWRNPRDIGLNFSKSMGWTDNEIFTKLQGDHRLYKRSSLTLPQVKRDDDARELQERDSAEKENTKPSNIEKLPEIKHSKSGSPEHKKIVVEKEVKEVPSNVKTRGKRSPKKNKFVKRLSNGDRVQKFVPSEDSDEYVVDRGQNVEPVNVGEKKPTPEATILRVTGGVELVPLLARRRRVGARTLPSSDVTRPPDQYCQWREIDAQYLIDLKHQMQVKCEQIEEKRKGSAESVRRHHETWESLWGRPGHGAPQRGKYARSNLAQLLYVVPFANAQ
ncbi:uncharacterized protein LOC114363829 [Ostrinia furnacalis]|uniref:uncharacterized protein LOC114363829 n=1 Tax=Ostrinia furnacalis TaxID=93504 RepID=UPI00103FEAEB|nr:uncharacterized protein LOC114363829 [Ostrinia furnacalis]